MADVYVLLCCTVVVVLLATVWWFGRKRTVVDKGKAGSRRSSSRTQVEDVRLARLRKIGDQVGRADNPPCPSSQSEMDRKKEGQEVGEDLYSQFSKSSATNEGRPLDTMINDEGRQVPGNAEGRQVPENAKDRQVPENAKGRQVPENAKDRQVPENAKGRQVPEPENAKEVKNESTATEDSSEATCTPEAEQDSPGRLPSELLNPANQELSVKSERPRSPYQAEVEEKLPLGPSTVVSVGKSQKLWPTSSSMSMTLDDGGNPIIAPIKSLETLLQWFPGSDEMCVSCVPLHSRPSSASSKPRTLLCHDMMGGYQVDRFVQGSSTIEDYHFYHWHLIDTFVYFSHNLVTIPPPSWINSAHLHGVTCLGTFITEWKEGAEMCAKIFSSEFTTRSVVNQLVLIAEYYQFDGWLINIENPIAPQYVLCVEMFLRELSEQLHLRRPGSQIIWYDSVTKDGQLVWQNALNQKNVSFFHCCDGIFLNYNWNWSLLSETRKMAQNRLNDVYVGIDVFGRGCPGGGGYNSSEAMDMIRKAELSAAVFAPGWVFETQDKSRFIENQNKFWSMLEQYCEVKGVSGVPFVTSFGRGYGRVLSIDGEIVRRSTWTNHSAMDRQPTFISAVMRIGGQAAPSVFPVYVSLDEAYYNGGSLCVSGRVPAPGGMKGARSIVRLFYTQISLKKPLLVAYTFKLDHPGTVDHYVQLCNKGSPQYVLLRGSSSVAEKLEDEPDKIDQTLLERYNLPKSRPCELPSLGFANSADYIGFNPLPRDYSTNLHRFFTGHSHLQRNGWTTK
jgi:mannosyl-glycoprotein endo-beta-N-acetylglucosaminidase